MLLVLVVLAPASAALPQTVNGAFTDLVEALDPDEPASLLHTVDDRRPSQPGLLDEYRQIIRDQTALQERRARGEDVSRQLREIDERWRAFSRRIIARGLRFRRGGR
jgi:hypothetical protein